MTEIPDCVRSVVVENEHAMVTLGGDIDLVNASRLRRVLEGLTTERACLVLDMHDVGFIDSLGLSSLVSAHRAARERAGTVTVVRPSRRVFAALRLAGLVAVFHVADATADVHDTA